MLGTTQCINAILQREHLGRVGVVRLGAPATLAIPPLTDWPEDLRSQVAHACYIVAGGHEFDGRKLSPLDEARLRTIGQELAAVAIAIGGVRTNFRMPDLLSLGLGGGSIVQVERNRVSVGPRSVGYRLTTESRIFGGNTLTMTDIAVAAGMTCLGDPMLVRNLAPELVEQAVGAAVHLLTEGIDRVKTSPADLPLIAVGGGGMLVPDRLPGATTIVRPEHFDCANAIGAAIAQVSGEVDRIWHLEGRSRESILAEAREMACEKAYRAGADPGTLELIDSENIPLAYLPGNAVRLHVKVAGLLKMRSSERREG